MGRSNDRLRGVAVASARWRVAKYPGGSNRDSSGIGGKISRKETIGREVTSVIAAIEIPNHAGEAAPGHGTRACGCAGSEILSRRLARRYQKSRGSY